MPTVTVPGSSGGTLTYTFGTSAGFSVAQQIQNALAAAATAGTLSVTASSGVIPPASTVPGTI